MSNGMAGGRSEAVGQSACADGPAAARVRPRMAPVVRTLARSWRAWSWRVAAVAVLGWGSMGCSPQIGSSCTLSTDCSSQGDRVCDTSQPGGYCTILNCNSFSCPDHAVCVAFESTLPGCDPLAPYSDYQQPSRTSVAFCMEHCGNDSDCRSGYVCRNPRQAPWNASIVSDDQSLSVCITLSTYVPPPEDAAVALADGSVCSQVLPPPLASFADTGADVSTDTGSDVSTDGSAESDATPDAGAADAQSDADAGSPDATPDADAGASLDGSDDADGAGDGPSGG